MEELLQQLHLLARARDLDGQALQLLLHALLEVLQLEHLLRAPRLLLHTLLDDLRPRADVLVLGGHHALHVLQQQRARLPRARRADLLDVLARDDEHAEALLVLEDRLHASREGVQPDALVAHGRDVGARLGEQLELRDELLHVDARVEDGELSEGLEAVLEHARLVDQNRHHLRQARGRLFDLGMAVARGKLVLERLQQLVPTAVAEDGDGDALDAVGLRRWRDEMVGVR